MKRNAWSPRAARRVEEREARLLQRAMPTRKGVIERWRSLCDRHAVPDEIRERVMTIAATGEMDRLGLVADARSEIYALMRSVSEARYMQSIRTLIAESPDGWKDIPIEILDAWLENLKKIESEESEDLWRQAAIEARRRLAEDVADLITVDYPSDSA